MTNRWNCLWPCLRKQGNVIRETYSMPWSEKLSVILCFTYERLVIVHNSLPFLRPRPKNQSGLCTLVCNKRTRSSVWIRVRVAWRKSTIQRRLSVLTAVPSGTADGVHPRKKPKLRCVKSDHQLSSMIGWGPLEGTLAGDQTNIYKYKFENKSALHHTEVFENGEEQTQLKAVTEKST